jgi:segregation and condensation protein B
MAKSLKLILEALLFSSDKPLSIRDFRSFLPDEDASDIRNALKVLEHDYEVLDRSFTLKEVAKGHQFRSRSEYGSYILKMLQTTPNRLTRASMETLAIIAYKQPILRHEIERLRGVDVGGILRTLLEKGLIKIMGRKELPGRPLIYGTTKRFLEVFDLKDISSLPKLKEIQDFGSEEHEPAPVLQVEESGALPEKEDLRESVETSIDDAPAREADNLDNQDGLDSGEEAPVGASDDRVGEDTSEDISENVTEN